MYYACFQMMRMKLSIQLYNGACNVIPFNL